MSNTAVRRWEEGRRMGIASVLPYRRLCRCRSGGFDRGDSDGAVDPVGLEANLVAFLHGFEHLRVGDLEDHRHPGHAEVLDWAVPERHFPLFLVDLADLAFAHR